MTTQTTTRDNMSRSTHPVHVGHLVMGLAFLGLVGIWAAEQYGGVSGEDLRWLLPLPWVFAGGAGLLALAFSGRRRTPSPVPAGTPPYQPAYDLAPDDTDLGPETDPASSADIDTHEENR
ncbi:MAG: hypothetical protein U0R80_04130 [Nocardioidaceae bacterium]